MHIRYPFIYMHKGGQKWTVGIGEIDKENLEIKNIIAELTPDFVKKQTGYDEIADPWIIKHENRWFLFVEIIEKYFGRIAVFESSDLKEWNYSGLALNNEHHLSYPQVFIYEDEYFMIPESARGGGVFLYKATSFPLKWVCYKQLINGSLVDSTLFLWKGVNYLIAYDREQKCRLYYSDDLLDAEWIEHPKSPIGIGNRLRPGGRPIISNNKIIIPTQCSRKAYGTAVYKLEITKLSKHELSFSKKGRIIRPFKSQYFNSGIHHMDVCDIGNKKSVVAFDGRAGTTITYKRLNIKQSMRNNMYDLFTFFRIVCWLKWLE